MRILIDLSDQSLQLFDDNGRVVSRYPVSTAINGAGEREGSGCTPRGRHLIRAKVGGHAPRAAVFRGRRPTGEVWTTELARQYPERDWILTRILWLSGCEPGRNRRGEVDTLRRYIYIHGTPDDQPMGVPRSHGCVRMRNDDIIALFDQVEVGTTVDIVECLAEPGVDRSIGLSLEADRLARPGRNDVHGEEVSAIEIEIGDWAWAESGAMPVRETVFVHEQGVPPELERDVFDAVSRHALARRADQRVVGTGRLLPDGHVGRMAVTREARGQGVGGRILTALIDEARRLGMRELMLNAQVSAEGFYRRHGFVPEGETFLEAGIVHRAMRRVLDAR